MSGYRISATLWDKIHHFASFPQTGGESYTIDPCLRTCSHTRILTHFALVSLQQMVLFGQNPSQGTLFRASQFLAGQYFRLLNMLLTLCSFRHIEELPIRLAHRAKELDELPHNLSDMPSIKKVKNWYCQSFDVRVYRVSTSRPSLSLCARAYIHTTGVNQLSKVKTTATSQRRFAKPTQWPHDLPPRVDSKPLHVGSNVIKR